MAGVAPRETEADEWMAAAAVMVVAGETAADHAPTPASPSTLG